MQTQQDRITASEGAAQYMIAVFEQRYYGLKPFIEQAFDMFQTSPDTYLAAGPEVKRKINQLLFDRLWVTEDGIVVDHKRSDFFNDLANPELPDRLDQELAALIDEETQKNKNPTETGDEDEPRDLALVTGHWFE